MRTARLGLLELRAFEMTPHYRMGLLEMLLVRALVCRLWKHPVQGRLIRWDTRCTTASCFPTLCCATLRTCSKLRKAGYSFEEVWFAPHFEFRFPKIGTFGSEAWNWNCAGHWNPGMCLPKKRPQEERCAPSTPLSSEFR